MADRHERDAVLRARLRAADGIAAPDLWPQIERRVPTSLDVRRIRRSPMRRALIAAAALAVAGAGLFAISRAFVGPRPVVATDLPGRSGVAFLTADAAGHGFDLVLITGTHPGLHRVVLATGVGPDASPAWSPDGTAIAYVAQLSGGRSAIVVRSVAGRGFVRLTGCCRDADPAWSPNGATVAFVRSGPGPGAATTSIYVVASDGGPARELCPTDICGRGVAELAWSPDGTTIAFSHTGVIGSTGAAPPAGGIDLIGADGKNLRHLTACDRSHCTIDGAPSWSPDGTQVLYNRGAGLGKGQRFRVIDVATGATRTVAGCVVPHCPSRTVPVWSPDGRSIAYATSHLPATGEPAVIVANVRTGRLTVIPTCQAHPCGVPFGVVWSPNGTALVFVEGTRSGRVFVGQAVYLVSATGGPVERLAIASGTCCLAWQPEGPPSSP